MVSWTTPRTWVTSEIVTAALLNTHIRDNETYLKGNNDAGMQFDGFATFASANSGDVILANSTAAGGGLTAITVQRGSDNNRQIAFRMRTVGGSHEWRFQQGANTNEIELTEVGVQSAWKVDAAGDMAVFRKISGAQVQATKDAALNASMWSNAALVAKAAAGSYPAIGFDKAGVVSIAIFAKGSSGSDQLRAIDSGGTEFPLWTGNNDGSGSGLDADLLDGVQGSQYMRNDTDNNIGGHNLVNVERVEFPGTGNYIQRTAAANELGIYLNNVNRYKQQESLATFNSPGVYNTSWTASSDRRLKKAIQPFGSALDLVAQLEPITYEYSQLYKDRFSDEDALRHIGLIAQDVRTLFPDLVRGEETDETFLSVDYAKLNVPIVQAIKEIKTRLEALEAA